MIEKLLGYVTPEVSNTLNNIMEYILIGVLAGCMILLVGIMIHTIVLLVKSVVSTIKNSRKNNNRTDVPPFDITSTPRIPYNDLYSRSFRTIDRAVDRMVTPGFSGHSIGTITFSDAPAEDTNTSIKKDVKKPTKIKIPGIY